MAKNKITRKEIAEDKVLSLGKDYANSLQPAIDANQKWLESFAPIKQAALDYANIREKIKRAENRTEFLQAKAEEEKVRIKAINDIKVEQSLLISKQKVEQAIIDTKKKNIDLETKKQRQQKLTIKLTEKEKLELRILNRGKREAAVISSKLSTEYEKQAVKLTKLRRKYKDVALTQGESSKRAINLRKHIIQLDATLKRVDANVGQFQRSVGNYGKAMQSARAAAQSLASAMGLVGGAFLVVQVVRDAIRVIRDFEKQNATLSAILQVERKDMQGLTDDAVRLGETTVKTASQVAELQIAYARLGFEQQEILDLTEATISGSIAMNSELDQTANLVGAVVNTFDDLSATDAPRIIDILSLATAKSALNFQKLETGIPIVAGAADAAGIPFTRLIALMGKLADSGIDVSTSSTSLRNIFIDSADQGLNYEQILEKIKNSQDKLTAANDEFGRRTAVSSAVLAKNIDTTKELDDALNNAAGTAERMANKELDTLDGSIKLLRSAWEGYILNLNDSTEAGKNLKEGIAFLAKNLKDIISTVILGTKIWLAYKTAVLLARLQTTLMSKQAVLSRLAMIKQAQGVSTATLSWKAFNNALKTNAIFLVVAGIVGLISIINKLNKSIVETANELHESNEEFINQTKSTVNLNSELSEMAKRHDELKSKSELSKKEQKELDNIIKKIAKNIPDAVTGFDKYGNALDINTEKVKEFNKQSNQLAFDKATLNIINQKEALEELEKQLEKYTKKSIEGVQVRGSKFRDLTLEERVAVGEKIKGLEELITTTQKDIESNEDVIASVTGVKNARQLALEEQKRQIENDAKIAKEKAKEILIVKELRSKINSLKNNLKDLTKNGYANLTQAQADNIVETRKAIAEKEKELNSILGISNANKKAEKAEKERLAAEKKLKEDAFKLNEFSLKQNIKIQKSISENEKESFETRKEAIKEQSRLDLELALETATNKITQNKDFSTKEIESLLEDGIASNELKKKLGDEELLIIKQFQAKRKQIKENEEDATDTIDVEKIKANAEIKKAQKEKELNDELRLENELFNKKEGIYANEENAVELRERRIAEIKKKYALEALNTQVKSVEELLKNEELSAEKRAEYELLLSKIKLKISNLTTENFKENNDKEVASESEKNEKIIEIASGLYSALGDLANSIFDSKIQKIDDEIAREDEKFEKQLENENLTASERENIENQQEQKREELEGKKRKEQRKQAKLNKALAIADAGIATALAIISTYAQFPKADFGITASLFAGFIAATGAAQIGAILASPIPQFASGTENAPEGWAIVDENVPEVHTDKYGNIKSLGNSRGANLRYLEQGDKIYKSHKDYKELMRTSMLSSIDIDNKKLQKHQAQQSFEKHYSNEKAIEDAIANGFKKQKVHFHTTNNNNVKVDLNHEIWRANLLNRRR